MALIQETKPVVQLSTNLNDVFLTITIGNMQIGASTVWLDNDPPLAKGDISQLHIGKSANLVGRKLTIVTSVLDSNASTNNIIITIGFKGTTSPPFVFKKTLPNAGDIYALTTQFSF